MSQKNLSPEDRLDGVYRAVAFVLLAIGINYAIAVLRIVLPQGGGGNEIWVWARYAVLIVVPALCLLTFWRSYAFKRTCAGCSLMARGGFVFESIQKSAVRAAFAAWPVLVVLDEMADEVALPATFFLGIALAVLTLTFSISYLISSYVGSADE